MAKTMFNFGDPHKDFTPIADEILGEYKVMYVPITNCRVFYNSKLQMVDAAYGEAMVLDTLTMIKNMGRLKQGDQIVFLGSMGSLSPDIELDDLAVPGNLLYARVDGREVIRKRKIQPNRPLYQKLKQALKANDKSFRHYLHGSVAAVFDPTTDHKGYTNRLYEGAEGLDCSESYVGLKFCEDNGLLGVVLLYCSDDPVHHIGNIPKEEFDKRALERDMELHRIAKQVLLD